MGRAGRGGEAHGQMSSVATAFRATARPGACAASDFDDGFACEHGDSGAWLLDQAGIAVQTVACLRLCLSCARCSYISVGYTLRDCSWYSSCPALDDAAPRPVKGSQQSHISGAVDRTVWEARLRGLPGADAELARMPAGGWSTGPGAGRVQLDFVHVCRAGRTVVNPAPSRVPPHHFEPCCR